MASFHTRRQFLNRAVQWGAIAAGLSARPRLAPSAASTQANDKLNLGIVGVAGRGGENLSGVASQNVVALCDVDSRNLEAAAARFPGAKSYRDFRRMLDQGGLDALVVSTPDHTHAVVVAAALKKGLHVYCEKPLARTVSEVRRLTELARQHKRVTQIGTQIHAGNNYRRVVELVQGGTVGTVREVHVWASATYGGMELPKDRPPVPATLDYDLWLGPVPHRPYSPEYVPFKWRHWWAFGGGALADFGCHFMDLPHWALGLSHVSSAEVVDGPPVHPESTPPWLIVRYQHPARGIQPPVVLTWYHGGKQPTMLTPEQAKEWKSGVLFVGEKGQVLADYSRHILLPAESFADYKRPALSIPESVGHHQEWIEACKGRRATTCPFDYSGPLSETALLGNVAYRAAIKIDWDSAALKARGTDAAEAYIQHQYREGWSV